MSEKTHKCLILKLNLILSKQTRSEASKNKVIITIQFVIFKPLSYCFKETIGFDVKASFTSRPMSRLIR